MFSTVVYIEAQTNLAPNAFRTSTIISQYITKFAMYQVCDQARPNFSIAVSQLRRDKFFCIPCETGVHLDACDPQV